MKERIKKKLIVLAFAVVLAGCSKEPENIPASVEKEPDAKTLTIRVSGVASTKHESAQLQSRASAAIQIGSKRLIKKTIEEREGFDVQATITEDINDNDAFAQDKSASKFRAGTSNKAASSTIASNVKYRVILYSLGPDDTETFHSSHLFTGTEDQQITITESKNYKWYAYSYNSEVEPVDISSEVSPTVSVENVDFLYANGNVSLTPEEDNIINIQFQRKTSKVSVEIDARGMFAEKISELQVDILPDFLYGATFDIKTGQTISTNTFTATGLLLEDFTKGDETLPDFEGIVRKEFYTAKENSISGEIFNLKSFKIQDIADEAEKSMQFTNANGTFQTPPIQNIFGNEYKLRMNLIQSALTVYGWDQNRPIYFARGNLYDTDNSLAPGENNNGTRYKFRNQGYDGSIPNDVNKDVFRINSSVAGIDNTDSVDPCSQIYPEGTWSSIDIRNGAMDYLIYTSNLGTLNRYNSLILNKGVSATGAPYPDAYMQLTMGGHYRIENDGTKTFNEVTYYSTPTIMYQIQVLPSGITLHNVWQPDRMLMNVRCIRAN